MKRRLLFVFLVGILILQSCTNNNQRTENNSNSNTQIEIQQNAPVKNEESPKKNDLPFRLKHPYIFTILIISCLVLLIILISMLPGFIEKQGKSMILDGVIKGLISKIFRL